MAKPRIESRQFGSKACTLNSYKESGLICLVHFFSYLFDQGTLSHEIPLTISPKTFQNILIRVNGVTGERIYCKNNKVGRQLDRRGRKKGRGGQRELPGTVQKLLASDSWAQILVVPLCDLPWALVSPSVSQSCCKDAVKLCIWDGD